MRWFQREFSTSNIISGFLAIVIWCAIIYLSIAQIDVPEILYFGGASVIAFFFGSKVGVQSERLRAEVRKLEQKERSYNEWLQGNG